MNKIEMNEDKVLFCGGHPCDVHINENHHPCNGCLIEYIVYEWNKNQRS